MKNIGFWFVVIVVSFSCEHRLERFPKPENLITKDSMVMIMKDMMVLESFIQKKYPTLPQYHYSIKESVTKMFAKYRIDSVRFDKSLEYYGARHSEMQSIYNEILDEVNEESIKLQNGKGNKATK